MELINETPMPAAFVIGQPEKPAPSEPESADIPFTLVVKGTFQLTPGEVVRFAEEMLLPTGDEPYEDDPDALGAVRALQASGVPILLVYLSMRVEIEATAVIPEGNGGGNREEAG